MKIVAERTRSGARDRLHWCVRKLSSEKGGKHDPEKRYGALNYDR